MPKREEVINYIRRFWREKHYSPSVHEMADFFKTSTAVISYHLDFLEREHKIMPRDPKLARTIVPVELAQAIENFYNSN